MATKKTDKQESRFYIVKTVNKTMEKLKETAEGYNEKFVKKPFDGGREFVKELTGDPVKAIEDLIDDARETLLKTRSEQTRKMRTTIETRKKQVQGRIDTIGQKTRTVYNGIENDAKLILEDLSDLGKKNLDKVPMKKVIEKRINAVIDSLPERLNLPSKAEIEVLLSDIDGVNKKVDALSKNYATA